MNQKAMNPRRRVRRRRPVRAGFTLMEVLLVLAILVVLAGLVVMNFDTILGTVDTKSTIAQVDLFDKAVKLYKLDMRMPPNTLDDLIIEPSSTGNSRSKWNGPYLDTKEIPMDGWGNPYQMEIDDAGKVFIYSYGPDGTGGNEDDITNEK